MGYITSLPESHPNFRSFIRKRTGDAQERLVFEKLWKTGNSVYGDYCPKDPSTPRVKSKPSEAVWGTSSWDTTYGQYGKDLHAGPPISSRNTMDKRHKSPIATCKSPLLSSRYQLPNRTLLNPSQQDTSTSSLNQMQSFRPSQTSADMLSRSSQSEEKRLGGRRRLPSTSVAAISADLSLPRDVAATRPHRRLPPLVVGGGRRGEDGTPYVMTGLGKANMEHRLGRFWTKDRKTNIN